jgi:putative tryptophan/tyrosine transport system substrate-binding protein
VIRRFVLEETTMTRRTIGLLITLVLGLLVAPLAADAQPPAKVPRVGFLRHSHQADESRLGRLDEFRQGLQDLGYVEGHNLILEVRWSEERLDRLPELAAELIRLPVDVLVVHGVDGARAAKDLTTTLPIVIARTDEVMTHGLVASLARPGGNITGLSFQGEALSGKWLELLKEALPRLSRVGVLTTEGAHNQRRTLEHAAHSMGVPLQVVEVRRTDEFEAAVAAMHTAQADGLVILSSRLFTQEAPRLAALAATHRLPAIYYHRRFAEAGGLMAYGPKESDASWGFRRAAVYVDKILKGAKPAELPVEQPMTFELVINLTTAQALGLTIPPTLLFQATEVIQ